MITKKFGVDFNSSGGALTLYSNEVMSGNQPVREEPYTKTHDDGWTITARVYEDYYYWINDFEAVHPKFGKVWGDFEHEVYADSEEGFKDFYEKHTPEEWDYGDI